MKQQETDVSNDNIKKGLFMNQTNFKLTTLCIYIYNIL